MSLTRRRWLAGAAACAAVGARAQVAPLRLWIEAAPFAGLDLQALFMEAALASSPASHELEAIALARDASAAGVRISTKLERIPESWESARLGFLTQADIAGAGMGTFALALRSETAVVLPYKGEGGWEEEGRYALRSAVKRCARDVILLLQTEMSMRRRGYWWQRVGKERLTKVQLSTEPGAPAHDCIIIRETDASLFLADTDMDGRVSDNRLIVDKPLVLEDS